MKKETMVESDLRAWLCKDCAYEGNGKAVVLLPPEMQHKTVKYCPFEDHSEAKKIVKRN